MEGVSNKFTLYLSPEGDAVKISNFTDSTTLPEQAQAAACKTHEQVLAFLKGIRGSDVREQLDFFHENNSSYQAHVGTFPKGVAHPCSLEKQIDFVRYKIGESTQGVRDSSSLYSLCKIQ